MHAPMLANNAKRYAAQAARDRVLMCGWVGIFGTHADRLKQALRPLDLACPLLIADGEIACCVELRSSKNAPAWTVGR